VAIENALLSLCSSACYAAATDAEGEFVYEGVPADHYKLEVRGSSSDSRRLGVAYFPVDLAPDAKLTLPAAIILPETGEGTPLASGEHTIAIDSQLSLHVDGEQIVLPFGETESYLAGVRVSEAHWPPNVPTDGSVVAVWSLNPHGMTSMVPIGFDISDTFGLAVATSLDVQTVDLLTAELTNVATAVVGETGSATTTDEGITLISWLVLSKSP
jgi:hypothetical protein